MSLFRDFVLDGNVGELGLNMPRDRVIRLLGEPRDWLGKSTIIGERCSNYDQSELWFFYEGTVGVRFADDDRSSEILLYPKNFMRYVGLFQDWRSPPNLTMGEWRTALVEREISFRESDSENLNYWIIAAQTCVAFGFPFSTAGMPLKAYERPVDILSKFGSAETMRRKCKFV